MDIKQLTGAEAAAVAKDKGDDESKKDDEAKDEEKKDDEKAAEPAPTATNKKKK